MFIFIQYFICFINLITLIIPKFHHLNCKFCYIYKDWGWSFHEVLQLGRKDGLKPKKPMNDCVKKRGNLFLHLYKFLPAPHHFRRRLFYPFKKWLSDYYFWNIFRTSFLEHVLGIPNLYWIFYHGNTFAYETTLLETRKILKDNFDIFEKYRGVGRKM